MCPGLCNRSRKCTLISCGLAGRHSIGSGHVPVASCAEVSCATFLCVATQEMVQNISCSCDIGIIFFKLPSIKCQQTTGAFIVVLGQHEFAKFCRIRQPKRSRAGVGKFSQEERDSLPAGPIKCATAGLVFGGPLCLHFIVFNEYPSQVARLQVQDLLEQVRGFRQIHTANAEVEAVRGQPALARDAIENCGRDLKVDPARSNKECVKFILMLCEKAEFL